MHSKLRDAFCALAGAGAMAVVFYTAMPVLGQQKPATTAGIPRLNGKPDLNGVWQALNTANWDLEAHSARRAGHAAGPYRAGAGQGSDRVRRGRIGARRHGCR